MDGVQELGVRLLVLVLGVLVGLVVLSILATCCIQLFESEAVGVDNSAATLTAPRFRDHRTDPPVTTSTTHPAVLQTTPLYQPQPLADSPEHESARHVVDYQTTVPIDHDSYTAYYTTLPPQTMENTVDITPTNDAPPPYKALFTS